MSAAFDLVLRKGLLPDGAQADIGIVGGRIADIAPRLAASDNDIDCHGKAVLPGLHDHHIHMLATAARMQSVDLTGLIDPHAVSRALQVHAATLKPGAWLRAIGYDERAAGIPDRGVLDSWVADHPLRMQDRTGALWVLNSAALRLIGDAPWPDAVETGGDGLPTGRIWRGDDWLRHQIGSVPPSLAALSLTLARWGVTAVTDAGAQNGVEEAAIFSAAIDSGDLRQRLTLMGREDLPAGDGYTLGPLKLLFDERALPDVSSIAARIASARGIGRNVAAHCVTEAELLTYLAALDHAGGARAGDRIEHGSMIPHSLIADIAASRLTVVANPGFIARRGDRYLAEIDAIDLPNLHRLASLTSAGVPVLAGSDAPYGSANPWVAIRAGMHRQAPSGAVLGGDEALTGEQALALYRSAGAIEIGATVDCIVLESGWAERLCDHPDPCPVALTLISGEPI